MAVSIYTSTNSARGFPYLYTLFSIYCLFILVCILIPCPNLSLQVMRHYHIFIHHFHKYLLDVTISFWYQQNLYLLKNTIISSQFYRLAIWAKLIWYNWSTLHVGWWGGSWYHSWIHGQLTIAYTHISHHTKKWENMIRRRRKLINKNRHRNNMGDRSRARLLN